MSTDGVGEAGSAFDVVVVGNGLFGSAAARHLAERGVRVAVVGPGEPPDHTAHEGVYASHYDEGRLTRRFDKRPEWAPFTARAIDGYQALQEASGIEFHRPVGALIAGRADLLDGPHDPRISLAERAIDHEFWGPGDSGWRARFGAIDLPDDFWLVYEPAPAGHINPRRLIAAQNTVAARHGAAVIPDRCTRVRRESGGLRIDLAQGSSIAAKAVLVAAGAFTNFGGLVPEPLPLTIETEIVAYGQVSATTAAHLADYPTLVYDIVDPTIGDIYLVPPLRFPDGNHYIKIGANTDRDIFPTTLAEIQAWFRSGDSDFALPAFEAALRALWPTTDFLDFATGRCILCRTPSGSPLVTEVERGWFVATGGNGGGAKGSDAWGERAADLVLGSGT